VRKFKVGHIYNHTLKNGEPYYGCGWLCTFITAGGWGVLESPDDRVPPKLELLTERWVTGKKKDRRVYALRVGSQMDYMNDAD
jgi:hypothetical protein